MDPIESSTAPTDGQAPGGGTPPATPALDSRMTVRHAETLVNVFKSVMKTDLLELLSDRLVELGHWSLLAAQLLTAVFFTIAVFRLQSWTYLLYAVGFVVLLAALQFSADRFCRPGRFLGLSRRVVVRSPEVLDCAGLIFEAAGLLLFLTYVATAYTVSRWEMVLTGLLAWAVLDVFACVCFKPALINVHFSPDVRGSREVLGLLTFLVNAASRVILPAFGIGAFLGAAGLALGIFSLLKSAHPLPGFTSLRLVAVSAALPFAGYLLLAACHLLLDILRSLVSVRDTTAAKDA